MPRSITPTASMTNRRGLEQSPITTQLSRPETYSLPLNVKREIARLGKEVPDFAQARISEPGIMGRFLSLLPGGGPGTTMAETNPYSGNITVMPELAGKIPSEIGDLLRHEQTHREQRERLGPFGMYRQMASERSQPYSQQSLEMEAFQSMRDRARMQKRPPMVGMPLFEPDITKAEDDPSKYFNLRGDIYLPSARRK
jgi:hypothetical protein